MKKSNVSERRLSVQDMAERLGVSRKTIEFWAEIGVLHPVIFAKGIYFKKTADSEFFDEWAGYDLNTEESAKASVYLKRHASKA